MEIIIGKTAGFCFGVKRAVEGSLEKVQNSDKKVYCLGELVHNSEVIKNIEKNGITVIDNLDEIKKNDAKIIIRAHGVDKKIYDEAKRRGFEIIDFTCPFVSKIHKIAEEYKEKDNYIFLVGSKIHPEIIGTASHCGDDYTIIESEDDVLVAQDKFVKSGKKKLLVIVQTTFSKKKFSEIEKRILESINKEIEITIKNTICLATEQRQNETEELSKKVDIMIIVGGKNSSNTKKLYEIVCKNCVNTYIVETANELELDKEKKHDIIGIMAGASTPNESIEEVVNKISFTFT